MGIGTYDSGKMYEISSTVANNCIIKDQPVCISKYYVIQCIGASEFAKTYHVKCDGKEYALKMVDFSLTCNAINKGFIEKLNNIHHQCITKLVETFNTDSNHTCFVYEFCNGGTLQDYLIWLRSQQKYQGIGEPYAILILRLIISAYGYLRSQGIENIDITLSNILLHFDKGKIRTPQEDFPRVFIRDFSVTRIAKANKKIQASALSQSQLAPEMFQGEITEKSYIWDLGISLYAMLTGCLPFPASKYEEFVGKGTYYLPKTFSLCCIDFIEKCLQNDKKNRFTWEKLTIHPFLGYTSELEKRVTYKEIPKNCYIVKSKNGPDFYELNSRRISGAIILDKITEDECLKFHKNIAKGKLEISKEFILVIGRSGEGKSNFINTLLGEYKAKTSNSWKSQTVNFTPYQTLHEGKIYYFVDTQGFADTKFADLSEEERKTNEKKLIDNLANYLASKHNSSFSLKIVLAISCTDPRMTSEKRMAVEGIINVFCGKDVLNSTLCVLTKADFHRDNIKKLDGAIEDCKDFFSAIHGKNDIQIITWGSELDQDTGETSFHNPKYKDFASQAEDFWKMIKTCKPLDQPQFKSIQERKKLMIAGYKLPAEGPFFKWCNVHYYIQCDTGVESTFKKFCRRTGNIVGNILTFTHSVGAVVGTVMMFLPFGFVVGGVCMVADSTLAYISRTLAKRAMFHEGKNHLQIALSEITEDKTAQIVKWEISKTVNNEKGMDSCRISVLEEKKYSDGRTLEVVIQTYATTANFELLINSFFEATKSLKNSFDKNMGETGWK